jgi:ribosomal protein S18 acetylase RimI-like enzyme
VETIIKQITAVDEPLIFQLNTLLDEGLRWDIDQGKKFLENKDNALFISYSGRKVSGFLSGYRLQRFDNKRAEVLLYEIGVDESFQRQGIGKSLIQALKQWAKNTDANEIWVLTNRANKAAVSLYKSEGGIIENVDEQMYVFKI